MRSPADLLRLAVRLAIGVALVGAVGLLAHVPLGETPEHALLRLDLRTAIAHVEVCRDRTEAELETLPIHMRRARECREVRPAYALDVSVDGAPVVGTSIAPHGIRKNRPLTGEVEVPLEPGVHHLEVRFEPVVPEELIQEDQSAFDRLPRFRFDDEIVAERGRVVLLTIDEKGERLRLIGS